MISEWPEIELLRNISECKRNPSSIFYSETNKLGLAKEIVTSITNTCFIFLFISVKDTALITKGKSRILRRDELKSLSVLFCFNYFNKFFYDSISIQLSRFNFEDT